MAARTVIVTRFAPSPNGHLHLGHAFAAIFAYDLAMDDGGQFLLRIEDIDGLRSLPELADEFRRDLEWLGLEWEEVPAQSTRLESYHAAAQDLLARGFLYPCTCTRAEIKRLATRKGPEGYVYPGTCRGNPCDPAKPAALRLDVDCAMREVGEIVWMDEELGSIIADPRDLGDVVIVRKDEPASYHLAVTMDDAGDGVTLVTRGTDLIFATDVHRVLQELLELPVPDWFHNPLVLDETGQKLAKRRGSACLADRRRAGEDGRRLADQLRQHCLPAGNSLEKA